MFDYNEELTLDELLYGELANDRVAYIIGGEEYENVINKNNVKEILQILNKMFNEFNNHNKYLKKGYKLLKEMGEDKIVSEIDSGNYMSFCPWE